MTIPHQQDSQHRRQSSLRRHLRNALRRPRTADTTGTRTLRAAGCRPSVGDAQNQMAFQLLNELDPFATAPAAAAACSPLRRAPEATAACATCEAAVCAAPAICRCLDVTRGHLRCGAAGVCRVPGGRTSLSYSRTFSPASSLDARSETVSKTCCRSSRVKALARCGLVAALSSCST